MRKGEDVCKVMFMQSHTLKLDPQFLYKYFNLFFNDLITFDKENIKDLLEKNASNGEMQFRTVAQKFRLIENQRYCSLIVKYPKNELFVDKLIEKLRYTSDRDTMRKLQRYTISVAKRELEKLVETGEIVEQNGLWVQAADTLYNDVIGFVSKNNLIWDPESYIVSS
jgi:CRISPR-associated endonuclease/helicase Cas3